MPNGALVSMPERAATQQILELIKSVTIGGSDSHNVHDYVRMRKQNLRKSLSTTCLYFCYVGHFCMRKGADWNGRAY